MVVNISFTGDIANPITDARIMQAISANQLAKRLGLSRQYLSRAEQGTYSNLNPALKRWVANALSIGVASVEKRYLVFQAAQRRATVEKIDPHRLERHSSDEPGHVIFERWRNGYWSSPMSFAVAMCVHPDSVQKYEEGIQKKMPDQLHFALSQMDLIESNWVEGPSQVEATGRRLRA